MVSLLLLFGVQLCYSVLLLDVIYLCDQVIVQVCKFESYVIVVGLLVQMVIVVCYVLCIMFDELVFNVLWGEQSGWVQKILLVIFYGEFYGGVKFFQILEWLCVDFSWYIDLIELMYLCLVLGFGGCYQIELGGCVKLVDIQEDFYCCIKVQCVLVVDELVLYWCGIEDWCNLLICYVLLWVIVVVVVCVLLVVFVVFYMCFNVVFVLVSVQVVQIGLDSVMLLDICVLLLVLYKSFK